MKKQIKHITKLTLQILNILYCTAAILSLITIIYVFIDINSHNLPSREETDHNAAYSEMFKSFIDTFNNSK